MLHEHAEWLEVNGVRVELAWVKSHHISAGNKLADRTAHQARTLQKNFSSDQYGGLVIDAGLTARIDEEINGNLGQMNVTHGPTNHLEHNPRNEDIQPASFLQQELPDGVESIATQPTMVGPAGANRQPKNKIDAPYRQLAEIDERRNAILSAITDKERQQTQDRQ